MSNQVRDIAQALLEGEPIRLCPHSTNESGEWWYATIGGTEYEITGTHPSDVLRSLAACLERR